MQITSEILAASVSFQLCSLDFTLFFIIWSFVSVLSDFILTYLFSSYPPFMALNGL